MSVFGLERSQTTTANAYDHAIILVDATQFESTPERNSEDSSAAPSIPSDSGASLNRNKPGTLRQQLAQRKYAKYQEDKAENGGPVIEPGSETGELASGESRPEEVERKGRKRDKIPFRSKKKSKKATDTVDSFIDVLYENQRGSFFCGIPLYSSNSLLNFDPAAWQNADFHDSGVNITNFQLPDPSWAWDWKTWYVDMSHDVDEEGWEYSFSFNKVYAWHGNHPWLFSFVRRRRWLRRRVRIHTHKADGEKSKMNQAHMLTEDYFTIHAANRVQSRDSSADRTTTNRSSYMNGLKNDREEEPDPNDITNVSALMAALKQARLDREKFAAVKTFLDQGGDEIFYLPENMPAIMADFVHQTSCRQLQTYLLQVLDEATRSQTTPEGKGKEKNEEGSDSDLEARQRKIDNLLKSIHSAGVHVNDAGYWSELRTRATGSEADPTVETHALDATEPAEMGEGMGHAHSDDDENSIQEGIRGIPTEAHVSEEPRIRFSGSGDATGADSAHPMDKGKGKEE
ncbi:hypothetical protein P7C71_g6472, partial [Lecanoromycetidae sp. Uapishka_2]